MTKLVRVLYFNIKSRSLYTNVCNACVCQMPSYGPTETQRSEMLNGIKIVATKTSGTVMAGCTIMFQAGSRYETHDDLGACHFLRAASTTSGQGFTAYAKLRVLQQSGSYLTCTTNRESIYYTLLCPSSAFGDLKHYLFDTATRCCFNEWEISDIKPQVRSDLSWISPGQRVIDLVQRACWAGPLANSHFCEDARIDNMCGETLRRFVQTNFMPNRCTVASVGIPYEETLKVAEFVSCRRDMPDCEKHPPSRPRAGFECHDLGSGSDTWIAVAVPSCGSNDFNELQKHAILAAACGTDSLQEGDHEFNKTLQPPLGLMCGNDVFTSYKAFNISYADTGLFGIVAKTRSCSAKRTASSMSEFLSNISDIEFKQIEVGKKRLHLSLAQYEEDCVQMCEGFALQALHSVHIDRIDDLHAMIDKIPPDEIKLAAKLLSCNSSKMAVAIVGDVGAVQLKEEMFTR